jgi:hypothetical protein
MFNGGAAHQNDEDRKPFDDYVRDFRFQHDLIDRKITWLLTSQTILFAALGLTTAAPVLDLVHVIGLLGLAICIAVVIGLVGNIVAKYCVYRDYRERLESVRFGVRGWTTWFGIATDVLIPAAFIGAWIFVLRNAEDIVNAANGA